MGWFGHKMKNGSILYLRGGRNAMHGAFVDFQKSHVTKGHEKDWHRLELDGELIDKAIVWSVEEKLRSKIERYDFGKLLHGFLKTN